MSKYIRTKEFGVFVDLDDSFWLIKTYSTWEAAKSHADEFPVGSAVIGTRRVLTSSWERVLH